MTVKFFSTEHKIGTGGDFIDVKQVTKLNIIATPEEPHITTIDVPFNNKFNKIPIEILKMIGQKQNLIEVLANFDNTDNTDFENNPYVDFDGTMHLKTDYGFETELINEEEKIYSFDLNKLDVFGNKILSIDCEVI